MQLTFLGNRYNTNSSSMPVVEEKLGGIYRGQPWTRKHLQKPLAPDVICSLKYRGVRYLKLFYKQR